MPNQKRPRSLTASQPEAKRVAVAFKPEPTDNVNSRFANVAREHWLQPTRSKPAVVRDNVVKDELWQPLLKEDFSFQALAELESVQALESYLWPGFGPLSSDWHVLLMVALISSKRKDKLSTWEIFETRPELFPVFFRRVLSHSLDKLLSINIRNHILCFVIHAFQSLDCTIVRKECVPLVSIAIWHNLASDEKRDQLLSQDAHLKKVWRAAQKRYDAADNETRANLMFGRTWLAAMCLNFLELANGETQSRAHVLYAERFVELLTDLQSQLPTRRYVNTLLRDLHIIPALRLSPMLRYDDSGLLRDMHALLCHYTYFPIDDRTGAQLMAQEVYDRHCRSLAALQRASYKHFKEKLTVLALSNFGSIDRRSELQPLLECLSDAELQQLAQLLHIRTAYPSACGLSLTRSLLMEAFLTTFERQKPLNDIARSMHLAPTERHLYDKVLLRADDYHGAQPLALPKLNLQYLSIGDFLWRAMVLYRCESFFAVRSDIESVITRLQPGQPKVQGEKIFKGTSKMGLPISKPVISEVVPALVGEDVPSAVKAEITLDIRQAPPAARRDWDALRPDDVVFLVAVDASAVGNGHKTQDAASAAAAARKAHVLAVRTAEVVGFVDDEGRIAYRWPPARRDGNNNRNHFTRRLQVRLDASTFQSDRQDLERGKDDVYDKINLIVRRASRENNFKRVLESIRSLLMADVPLAPWLHEVFLGYGDPASATFKHLPNQLKQIDFRDTFLDWQHLVESLPGKTIEPSDDASGSFPPPYVLAFGDKQPPAANQQSSRKRRRGDEPSQPAEVDTVSVSTYTPPNSGPYLADAPRLNTIRFTPAQVEAIISGTQPGMTLIVGPPGTGKTDVVTQIINNVYHNFPHERTLLIAHSNQALNQLFAKITALDIDQRHLLRLGHGEEELDSDANFGKYGRVEAFLENRNRFLAEVTRLASSIGAPGAHGNSAETAGYFNMVYIEPVWAKFMVAADAPDSTAESINVAFPFHAYFSDAPQPLFPAGISRAEALEIAAGCRRHISKIFSELADAQPFEILRREREKANYLLTNEARIIAMTSTHAAMRRDEIASLGFKYDNVIVEEAAQITEVETFIPLSMQKPIKDKSGTTRPRLKRVVLCGDHYQNSPIIQNLAFRHYANLEQSLFSRLVRLGVPTIALDQQGRARPSIAGLYRWRYPGLTNLPHVTTAPEYLTANAGFKYDFQFINVPDYNGEGEREPVPHFVQNLGEAEYAVAIYQYMRLIGYPAKSITILTAYAGQRALVRDVLNHRCQNALFGMPKHVTTVDKYQGEQNDYIILSLTRTTRVGYLRDIRRITVALSRARLGLYILGRRAVFGTCLELKQAFAPLLARPAELVLITGETWPSLRSSSTSPDTAALSTTGTPLAGAGATSSGDNAETKAHDAVARGEEEQQLLSRLREVTIDGLEHMGMLVYDMSNERYQRQSDPDSHIAAATGANTTTALANATNVATVLQEPGNTPVVEVEMAPVENGDDEDVSAGAGDAQSQLNVDMEVDRMELGFEKEEL